MIVAEPKGSRHSTSVSLTADALRAAFGPGWVVRVQDPVALDDESVNLVDNAVEVHRAPVADAAADFGWRYGNIETFGAGASLSPLCRPDVTVAVTDLLP